MPTSSRLFFDFDGPILEVSERHFRVYADSVAELGGRPLVKSAFWEAKRSQVPESKILAESGLTPAAVERFTALKLSRIESADYLALDTVQPGVFPALLELHSRHPLTLVTLRNSRAMLEKQLDMLQLTTLFETVFSGRGAAQEGWKIKQDLVRLLNPQPLDWIIGDTETDIVAGQKLGIRTVAITNGIRAESRLHALKPTYVLPSAANLLDYPEWF